MGGAFHRPSKPKENQAICPERLNRCLCSSLSGIQPEKIIKAENKDVCSEEKLHLASADDISLVMKEEMAYFLSPRSLLFVLS